jgi:predicted ATPase/signal transduction histidine kinase
MSGAKINIPGYQIDEELYNGLRTVVYRGIRYIDSLPVVIKLLKNPYPSFSELVQFRNQYTIVKNLSFSGIIQVYDLESLYNGYMLVMEDFGGVALGDYFSCVQAEYTIFLQDFLRIAISICDGLNFLHNQRIIHKDIKPNNILINPKTKQVKLIDFSIASLLPRETQSLKNPNLLEGTLSYLAPEQTGRMNRAIDYRTDFYSLGITFYELLTGQLPFVSDDAMELIHCHIAKMPICVTHIKPELPQVIGKIISKLMAKNVEDRYQSTLGLKSDLETCLNQLNNNGKITYFEIAQKDICNNFIIPDKLYGRESEIETLLTCFERVSNGASELMLVAGFSGIGKTAVVNEVHKPIVRQRGYFIKGKYDQFNRNILFSAFVQAFRNLMEQLLAESDVQLQEWKSKILEAVGENGQIIIEVIPELEKIIGQQPAATELSGIAAQNRFNLLFKNFIQVFINKEHPLVIFLDDLQWADSASLKLINLLNSDSSISHLFTIGAYRDNEVYPAHPLMLMLEELQKNKAIINTIILKPLSQDSLNALVSNTLNCSIQTALSLTELIYRKTHGNPFFSTQFLKALYQDGLITFNEQGGWECDITKVQQVALTDNVVEFMSTQLQKLPVSTQKALKLAACIGNAFDLSTLAIVLEKSEIETATDLWAALQSGLVLPQTEIYKFYQGEENNHLEQQTRTTTQLAEYKFLHDRVQQAAYSLIPESQKQSTHLKIGRLLQQSLSEIEQEEKLFDIIGHLNLGQDLVTQLQEREALAQLNLAAGQKARNATAHNASKVYLQTGINLLTTDCWQSQYKLTLSLHIAVTESAYLNGELEEMEQKATLVLQSAQSILDKVKIYEIQISARTAQSQMLEAIDVGRNALVQLGVEIPFEADEVLTEEALQAIAKQLEDKKIEELVNLPIMSEPRIIAAMQILAMLFMPSLMGYPDLLPSLCSKMVSLSLQFGNSSASAIGYAGYGMVLSAFLGKVETGYCFGKVGLVLLDKLNIREFKSLTLEVFSTFLQHQQEPLRAAIVMTKEGYLAGIETGDFLYAGYNIVDCFVNYFFAGVHLNEWESEIENYCAVLASVKQDSPLTYIRMKQQTVYNLTEFVEKPDILSGNAYDETVMIPKHRQDNELSAIAYAYIDKLILAFIFGNYTNALDYIAEINPCLMAVAGIIHTPVFHFYAGLTYLALYSTQLEDEQANTLNLVETHQTNLAQWASYAPMNHQHKFDLVEAEKYRVLGKSYQAGDYYDRAIAGANLNEFLQEQALANELAAKFYLNWGREKLAQLYMQEAYSCYAKWGAVAKSLALEKQYPQLLQKIFKQQINLKSLESVGTSQLCQNINSHSERSVMRSICHKLESGFDLDFFRCSVPQHDKFVPNWDASESLIAPTIFSSTSISGTIISNTLDFNSVIKAAQAISSNIQLDELITNLTKVIIENSGAKKAALILPEDETWQVRAITFIDYQNNFQSNIQTILEPQIIDTCQYIPKTIINYVKNTQTTTIIDDCQTNIPGLIGEYMLKHQPKSVLCTPVINQGNLVGVLYLENSITSGVFTEERLQVVKLLSSQAAISLKNAQLYHKAQQALQNLQQAQLQIVQSEKMSALGNLVAGVAHEMNNPLGFIAATLEQVKPIFSDISEHLNLYQQNLLNKSEEILKHAKAIDLDYNLEDLPKMIDAMTMACERLKNISTSLRTFSRADKYHKTLFNIHEGIDSTILILKHRLKANDQRPAIEVIANYGSLPKVTCFPGQLNQVFMNIIANAVDALDDSNIGRSFERIKINPNRIIIKTSVEDNCVKISIADNAKGMSEEIRQKIFDHLFTTKEVGRGTGLGLAIAKQIVEQTHAGKLSCNSAVGEGTEFIIKIPV